MDGQSLLFIVISAQILPCNDGVQRVAELNENARE